MPRVQANGVELEYDERGDGPALVLIMGIGAQMVLWRDGFCDQLAEAGFRVIRFDNRDVGLSTWLDDAPVPDAGGALLRAVAGRSVEAPYTLWDMADDTAGLLDALRIRQAHVVGVSMGGMVAQCLAIRHPDRLRSLTSMMSTTGKRRHSLGHPKALKALLGPRPRSREEIADYFVAFTRAVSGSVHRPDEDEVRDLAGRLYDRGHHPAGFARHLGAILATGDRTRHLQAVRAPTRVLHGAEDPLIPVRGGRATAAAVPNADFHALPGLGHNMPESAWSWFIDHIATHAHSADRSEGPPPIE